MVEKQLSRRPGKLLVTFRVSCSIWAEEIRLVGDFNAASRAGLPMTQTANDPDWHMTVELDLGRKYRFGYLIDGWQWNAELQADDCVAGPWGRVWSVLDTSLDHLYCPPWALHPASEGAPRTGVEPAMMH